MACNSYGCSPEVSYQKLVYRRGSWHIPWQEISYYSIASPEYHLRSCDYLLFLEVPRAPFRRHKLKFLDLSSQAIHFKSEKTRFRFELARFRTRNNEGARHRR